MNTGFKDRNGTMIKDGDKVQSVLGGQGEIRHEHGEYRVFWQYGYNARVADAWRTMEVITGENYDKAQYDL